jgi:hypothetical protein
MEGVYDVLLDTVNLWLVTLSITIHRHGERERSNPVFISVLKELEA